MRLEYIHPTRVATDLAINTEICEIYKECNGMVVDTDPINSSIRGSTDVLLALDEKEIICGFSVFHMSDITLSFPSTDVYNNCKTIYRSAVFVRPQFQRRGIASKMTRSTIVKYQPDCFCTTSFHIAWLRSLRSILVSEDYICSPQETGITSEAVIRAARAVLIATGRQPGRITKGLVRSGVYSDEKLPLANNHARFHFRSGSGAGDGQMLIAFKKAYCEKE